MTEFTANDEVPVEVSVRVFVIEVFTAMLAKSRFAALIVNWRFAAVPVPIRAITEVLPVVELLLIVTCPPAEPVDIGLNCTCKVTDCVGFSVIGKLCARIVNPVPLMAAEFTVTAEVPVDVRVRTCVATVFTVTLPKFRLRALTVSCGLGAALLVPLSKTTAVLSVDELLLIVSCPLADPIVVGLNCTCNVTDCVGFNVTGRLPPRIAKPAPVTTAEFTVTGAVPAEVSVND
jgi:hypothetical protein